MIGINTDRFYYQRCLVAVGLLAALVFLSSCASLNTAPVEKSMAPESKHKSLSGDLLYDLLVAEFAGNTGDLSTSVDFYQQAANSSNDERVAARATYIALYNKQYKQALKSLNRWHELSPENPEIKQMYAITYLHLHQPMAALPYVQMTLIQGDGSNKEKALAIKELLGNDIDIQDALVLLDGLNQAATGNPQMLILQAKFAAQLERYGKSIELLDRVLVIDASLLDVHLIKARIYRAQGKRDAAKAVIKQVLQAHPDNLSLRIEYARMLVEDKAFVAAGEQYRLLQEKQPDNVEIVLNLALLYIETERLSEAGELFEHLLKLDQKTDIAHYYLARIAQNKERYKAAITHYAKVKKGSYAFESKLRIASLLARLNRVDEAIDALEVLVNETEGREARVRIYLAQGEIYRSRQRYKDAFDMYSGALRRNREDVSLLYARALIAEKVDRIDIAEADLLKVLSMEPENYDALNALGYTLADKTKRYAEAKKYIEKAAALVPDDPSIMDSLGWISYRMGELQEAIKWLSKAFEKLADAEIAAHYGEVLWQANQKEKARKIWQKGSEVNAKHPVLVETLKRFKP